MRGAPYWVRAGDGARVLVHDGVILLVVYRACGDADCWESGFSWFSAGRSASHWFLQAADEITELGWETACELASRQHFDPLAIGEYPDFESRACSWRRGARDR